MGLLRYAQGTGVTPYAPSSESEGIIFPEIFSGVFFIGCGIPFSVFQWCFEFIAGF